MQDAAREFGVTPKTILGDINVLMFCGLPGLGHGRPHRGRLRGARGRQRHPAVQRRLPRPAAAARHPAGRRARGRAAQPARGQRGSQREVVERTLREDRGRRRGGGTGGGAGRPARPRRRRGGGHPATGSCEAIAAAAPGPAHPPLHRSATSSPAAPWTRSRFPTRTAAPTSTRGATSRRTGGCSGWTGWSRSR